MEISEAIISKIKEILTNVINQEVSDNEIILTKNKDNVHGDYSSNVALKFAKRASMKPIDLANEIHNKLNVEGVEKVEVAGIGFINFYLSQDLLGSIIKDICTQKDNYGQTTVENPVKVNLEYVSANPTGYLHLGHARGAALGDAMARIMKKAGYDVTREYYINDAGHQVEMLAKSLMVRYQQALGLKNRMPHDGYHGEEIKIVAKTLVEKYYDKYAEKNESNLNFFKENGIKFLLNQIVLDLKEFRVDFDVFTSETWVRSTGRIPNVLERLKNYCYVSEGATFLRTTDESLNLKEKDDKDRVIVKSDGSYAYFLPDIAYHDYKYERGFDKLVTLLGADHHGYIARLKAAMKCLGHNPDDLIIPLVQIVRLFKNGQEFRMSKRTGNAISMRELINEVGVDATRYFFVSRSGSQHLDFDIGLAKTLGNSNPVYYAQYTHARFTSILEKGREKGYTDYDYKSDLLVSEEEKTLMKTLSDFPNVIKDSAETYEPYKICNYIQNLCQVLNSFYQKHRVINDDEKELTLQRLGLVYATKIVLKNALELIAVSAPDKM